MFLIQQNIPDNWTTINLTKANDRFYESEFKFK